MSTMEHEEVDRRVGLTGSIRHIGKAPTRGPRDPMRPPWRSVWPWAGVPWPEPPPRPASESTSGQHGGSRPEAPLPGGPGTSRAPVTSEAPVTRKPR